MMVKNGVVRELSDIEMAQLDPSLLEYIRENIDVEQLPILEELVTKLERKSSEQEEDPGNEKVRLSAVKKEKTQDHDPKGNKIVLDLN